MFLIGFYVGSLAAGVAAVIALYFAGRLDLRRKRRDRIPATARAIRNHERKRRMALGLPPSRWLASPPDGGRP
jgi:hypothetical protein